MRIEKVRIEGFRLLEDVEIMLERVSTVIVGRNNSGKTSLTDVFDRFAGEAGPRFRLEDFSTGIRSKFMAAKALRDIGAPPEAVLIALPKIAITMSFVYDAGAADLGPLSPFIIDLDAACTTAVARVEYAATLSTLHFLLDIPPAGEGANETWHFYRCIRETLPKAYTVQVAAIDPTDPTNRRNFEGVAAFTALIQCGFVRAQRTLDHAKQGDPDVIGKLLGTLYRTANSPTAAEADKTLAANLDSCKILSRQSQLWRDTLVDDLTDARHQNTLGGALDQNGLVSEIEVTLRERHELMQEIPVFSGDSRHALLEILDPRASNPIVRRRRA